MGKKSTRQSKQLRAMTRKRTGPPEKAKKKTGGLKGAKGLSIKLRQATKSTAYKGVHAAGSDKKTDSTSETTASKEIAIDA
jgi:hypothetical protein